MEVPTLERWPVVLSLTAVRLFDIVSGSRTEVAPNHPLKGLSPTREIMDSRWLPNVTVWAWVWMSNPSGQEV